MLDPSRFPRVSQLLGRVEALLQARHRAVESSEVAELESQISDLYAEVGRYVHWLLRQDPRTHQPVQNEARKLRSAVAPGGPGLPPMASTPLPAVDPDSVSYGRSLGPAGRDPASVSVERLGADLGSVSVDARGLDLGSVSVDARSMDLGSVVSRSVVRAAYALPDAPWADSVQRVLRKASLRGERGGRPVRCVLDAVNSLERAGAELPDAVLRAVIGVLVSRAESLRVQTPGDVDLRLAEARLKRLHMGRELDPVPGIDAPAPPGGWDAELAVWLARLERGP